MSAGLYEQDFCAWANQQAALLRAGQVDAADLEHIAEEIESMAKAEKRELVDQLAVLLKHLLKWSFQPTGRCTSWRLTINEQRRELADHMADNPSLKPRLNEAIVRSDGAACCVAVANKSDGPIIMTGASPHPLVRQ